MTKVEELRDDLDELIEAEATKVLTADQFLKLPGFEKIMDAIVAAAKEQEKSEILKWVETDAETCDGGYGLLYTAVVSYLSLPEATS